MVPTDKCTWERGKYSGGQDWRGTFLSGGVWTEGVGRNLGKEIGKKKFATNFWR